MSDGVRGNCGVKIGNGLDPFLFSRRAGGAINKNFFFPKVMAEDLVEMRPFVKWEQIKACGEGLAPVLTGEQLACDLDCALFTLSAHGSCH